MADTDCAFGRLDPAALAWAAGFFDGEGSTFVYEPRQDYLRLTVSVSQAGGTTVPEVLQRFQAAMLGMGEIEPPLEDGTWKWRSRSFGESQAVIALLWRWLGPVKRAQATDALRSFLSQYGDDGLKARPPRLRPRSHGQHDEPAGSPSSSVLDLAWAAGFMDGEGCFGLVRDNGARKPDRPAWYRIRASACQHGVSGGIPHVLVRLREILGLGRFEPHGEPDAYKWVGAGPERVEQVLAKIEPWLGTVKRDQGSAALAAFRAQVRFKGSTTHCLRGHAYTREIPKANRASRKICNPCSRITHRVNRAAQGIKPRQFKNVARRYTF